MDPNAMQNMLGNPLLMTGLGLLSASRDRRVDPYQSAIQGLLGSAQYQQQAQQNQMQSKLYDARIAEMDRNKSVYDSQVATRQKVQGLLAENKADEAARIALTSDDPQLQHWAGGLLSPQKDTTPADVRSALWYQSASPEERAAFDKVNARQQNSFGMFLPTANGFVFGDQRSGQLSVPTINGAPVMPFAADPNAQGAVAQAKAGGKVEGETRAESRMNLPTNLANTEQTLKLLDEAVAHPGREAGTGLSYALDPRNMVPGTDAYNFNVRMKQLRGRNFLEAYQQLKGGGAITEPEGRKGEEAISRMDQAQSDAEFLQSAKDLQEVLTAGMERMRAKAGVSAAPNTGIQQGKQEGGGWGMRRLP